MMRATWMMLGPLLVLGCRASPTPSPTAAPTMIPQLATGSGPLENDENGTGPRPPAGPAISASSDWTRYLPVASTGDRQRPAPPALPTDVPIDAPPIGTAAVAGPISGAASDASRLTPIDMAGDRAALLAQVQGAATGVTGGLAGPDIWVTSLGNQGEGSLREALESPGPAWVRFAVDGVIRLHNPIRVQSDKTVDGRGQRVEIVESGLLVHKVSNIVITNLILREGADDGVSVYKSQRVWLDHLSLTGFDDGLIDITGQSTDVTVSWCRLEDHPKAMLVGSQDWTPEDAVIRLTVHHTFFREVRSRHPKMRFGYVHMYDILIDGWVDEAIDVGLGGRLLLEQSRLVPGPKSRKVFGLQVDPRNPPGFARAVGVDAGGMALEDSAVVEPPPYTYQAEPWSAELELALRERTGWQP